MAFYEPECLYLGIGKFQLLNVGFKAKFSIDAQHCFMKFGREAAYRIDRTGNLVGIHFHGAGHPVECEFILCRDPPRVNGGIGDRRDKADQADPVRAVAMKNITDVLCSKILPARIHCCLPHPIGHG